LLKSCCAKAAVETVLAHKASAATIIFMGRIPG
jgi:hypothetical protein